MPRRRPPARSTRPLILDQVTERRGGQAWQVRYLSGTTSTKTYTCPSCHRQIEPGTAHVVAWPVQKALLSESASDERRHWHRACWTRFR